MFFQRIYILCSFIVSILCMVSCSKNDIYEKVEVNKIKHGIESNSGLSFYQQAIRQTGFEELLSTQGPLTAFVPNDNSFISAGYNLAGLASTVNRDWTQQLVNYLVSEGNFRMSSLPFDFNTKIKSRNGHDIYLTKWIPVEGDTVYSLNGARMAKVDVSSNNGYMQVLDVMPVVNTYSNLADRIAGTDNLTLFSRALIVSGLDQLLKEEATYTVFAPSNNAMRNFGYTTINDVNEAHPDSLAQLVRRHILPEIYFRNDFRLLISFSETVNTDVDYYNSSTGQVMVFNTNSGRGSFNALMLSGDTVKFTYALGSAFITDALTNVDRLSLTMADKTAVARVDQKDFIADNGVMHVIDTVLPSN